MDPKQEESSKENKASKSTSKSKKFKPSIPSTEKAALQLIGLVRQHKKAAKRKLKSPKKVSYKRQKLDHDSDASSAHSVAELEDDIRSTEDYVKQINKFGDIDAVEAVS